MISIDEVSQMIEEGIGLNIISMEVDTISRESCLRNEKYVEDNLSTYVGCKSLGPLIASLDSKRP